MPFKSHTVRQAMGEMKSAWEIAMEKTANLEKASPEELKERKEEEHASIAQALADKLLGGLEGRHFEIELERHPPEDHPLLRQGVVLRLAEAIDLTDDETSRDAVTAIRYLRREAAEQAVEDQITELLNEHEQACEQLKQDLEKGVSERLVKLGISGSALNSVNPLADADGRQRLEELGFPFDERLKRLKQGLTE
jgi:hypothetical protein